MHVVQGRNINTVWIDGLWRLKLSGIQEDSRNGRVLVLPEPLTSVYTHPWERVLFHPQRDANPFFHLIESLWMLSGSCHLDPLPKYNSNIANFSDDGRELNGAYGFRWRFHFERDQLLEIVQMLKADPTTRRAVLGMWDPMEDLRSHSKDIPCNTHCYFRVRSGRLEMTVCCRSNDAIWGAYGANVVHFSILQEFIARAAGLQQGRLYQISNNFHIYERHWPLLEIPTVLLNYYYPAPDITVPLFNLIDSPEAFLEDCARLACDDSSPYVTYFFQEIVKPAQLAWDIHKKGNTFEAMQFLLTSMLMCDWRLAMYDWLKRRM